MKFFLDENVSSLVDESLQSMGHIVLRAPSGTRDKDLLALAQKEASAIITHDKDFATFSPSGTEGVVLLRIHPPWSKDVEEALKSFFSHIPSSAWRGKLVLLQKESFVISSKVL